MLKYSSNHTVVASAIEYITARLLNEEGDRFVLHELFKGASIFHPHVAKKLKKDEAMQLLEKLRHYPALDRPGEANIVNKLKKGWPAYKAKCKVSLSKFDYSVNDASILTWHYRNFLRIDEEYKSDSKAKSSCRYCGARKGKCSWVKYLDVYWEAAQLLR